jgi:PHP family Zn ribbon phosphoesterase
LITHYDPAGALRGDCDLEPLAWWARRKGISLVGIGDFTHPHAGRILSSWKSPRRWLSGRTSLPGFDSSTSTVNRVTRPRSLLEDGRATNAERLQAP